MFAAEQTWPTEDEMKNAAARKGSFEEEQEQIPEASDNQVKDLGSLLENMQITMVGKEHGRDDSDNFSESESDDDDYDEDKYF